MAYTYDQFTKAATDAGMLEKFSQLDLDTAKNNPEYGLSMLKLYQDEAGATTAEQKLLAQEAANQLRKTYGTLNTPNQTAAEQGSGFQYKNQTVYQDVLDKIVNREPFAYDQNEDPQYSAYRKAFLREADRAREDTLAKVSANSGGTPSSFAVTAAQQAGDYYVGQLNDQLPVLQQNAYQRYLNDAGLDISTLEVLTGDRSFDYSAYLQEQEKLAQAAELMAGQGDYTRLAALLGLTDAELAVLNGESADGSVSGSPGAYNPEVAKIQQELIAAGYDLTADGIWTQQLQDLYDEFLRSKDKGSNSVNYQQLAQSVLDSNIHGSPHVYASLVKDVVDFRNNGASGREILSYLQQAVREGMITQKQAGQIYNANLEQPTVRGNK